jgi:uncharacterized protein
MPTHAYLITRDRFDDPLPVDSSSSLGDSLDEDLAAIRDRFIDIKLHGAQYLPWKDDIVAINLSNQEESWSTAKEIIAREKTPGDDPELVYQIGSKAKQQLFALGYPSIDTLLREDPENIPLEECRGIGRKKAAQIRAVLQANRSGAANVPLDVTPSKKIHEFFIDYEYFTNVNVDFNSQWPTLDGCEMIFMIGVGWEESGEWRFVVIIAEAETYEAEKEMFRSFLERLEALAGCEMLDGSRTALYHWTSAEVWQTKRAAERFQHEEDHPLRKLPWCDLQKLFLNGPIGMPGAWSYGLKEITKALGKYNPDFVTCWPEELAEGLNAMVLGWRAFEKVEPVQSEEMKTLSQYLEADCKALWQILKWLRAEPDQA